MTDDERDWLALETRVLRQVALIAQTADPDSADGKFLVHIVVVAALLEHESRTSNDEPRVGLTGRQRAYVLDLLRASRPMSYDEAEDRARIEAATAVLPTLRATYEKSVASRQRRCDHKFIDSVWCLKCGWRPPSADAGIQGAQRP